MTSKTAAADDMIRLLLVDDHEVVRVGLRTLFARSTNIDVVGEAASVADAISEARRLRPRVVLMDLRLSDESGITACREILSREPTTRVLFLTSYSDEQAVRATVLAGAAGYLLKQIGHQALIDAITAVAAGQSILDPKITQNVLRQINDGVKAKNGAEELSPQERRVLAHVVEGKTNKQIAAALGLSDKTIKNYLSNAFQKLQVNRRSHAAVVFAKLANRNGPQ
ncbi:MAG TPA: response regulator transcription factor [Burkholderiales bacterium]|jgi:two-component system response regulator DevR|nr:response regulator transcription factor [Burkholderiales bacterium]